VSTLSLNQEDMAGAENTGWIPQRRNVSSSSFNLDEGMSAEDPQWEN